ncbi:MAG: PDZ domain-containing protein [Candidatus Magnetomorum sp.]|nr:PDZ domain-containing protein [Candidatus Magnetomorum sp.]
MESIKKLCPQKFEVWVAFLMGMVVIIIAIVVFDSVLIKSRSGQLQDAMRDVVIDTKGADISVNFAQTVNSEKDDDPDAWLGIEPMDITKEMANQLGLKVSGGVLVSRVVPGSPAEAAGLLRGDILYEFDHREIKDTDRLESFVEKLEPGDRVKISLFRNEDRLVVYAFLGERLDTTSQSSIRQISGVIPPNQKWGIVISELMPALRATYEIPLNESGVIVLMVVPGSFAEKAGVIKGDLIRHVNQTPVNGISDFFKALETADNQMLLNIYRQGSEMYINVAAANTTTDSQSYQFYAVAQEGIGMNRPLYVPGYDQTQSGDPDDKTKSLTSF